MFEELTQIIEVQEGKVIIYVDIKKGVFVVSGGNLDVDKSLGVKLAGETFLGISQRNDVILVSELKNPAHLL